MKQKIIIFAALVLLLTVIAFMFKDLFSGETSKEGNPYEYNISDLKKVDSAKIGYKKILEFSTGLKSIHGVCTGKDNKIYVGGIPGMEIYNETGKKTGGFNVSDSIHTLFVTKEKEIWVALENHLEKYDEKGKLLKKYPAFPEDAYITSIAVTDSFIFVADAGNMIVYCCNLEGEILHNIGGKSEDRRGFILPSMYFDLAIGKNREIWVANTGMHTLEAFSSTGKLLTSWKNASMTLEGFCGCCNPINFALLPDGSFVTAEKGIERVKIHSPKGEFVTVVASPKNFKEDTKGIDVAVDSNERIIVLDPVKKVISIFVKK